MADEAEFLSCIQLVLRESYLYHDIFSPQVNVGPGDYVLDLGGSIGTSAITIGRLVNAGGRYDLEEVQQDGKFVRIFAW